MTDMTLEQLEGRPMIGADGQKIGTVADVYFDKDTRQPEWALVTTGLFGTKHSFVPITSATTTGDGLSVPFTKDQVKDAPRLDDAGGAPQQTRQGRGPVGNDVSGPETDDAMTRSEEELRLDRSAAPRVSCG